MPRTAVKRESLGKNQGRKQCKGSFKTALRVSERPDYLLEQKEIQVSIPKKEEELEKLKDSVANVGAFLEKVK